MKKYLQNSKATFALGFIMLPLFLVVLCFLVNLFAPSTLKFPKPVLVFSELLTSLSEKKVREGLGSTFLNVVISLVVSFFFGILFGLVLGFNIHRWNLSQPAVDFFRSIPVTFLIPVFALLFGVTSANIIWLLASYPCMLIIIFHVRAGLSKQEAERVLSFCIISGSANPIKKFFSVTFFEILPGISTGFRIALSYCIVIVTVLEYSMVGSGRGIGRLVYDEWNNSNYTRLYSLIILIGFLGFLLNKIAELIDYYFFKWSKNNTNE